MHLVAMSLRRLFLLVTLICVGPALAGDLTVLVKEKGTGKVLEGATVAWVQAGAFDIASDKGEVVFAGATFPLTIKIANPGYKLFEQDYAASVSKIEAFVDPLRVEAEAVEVVADRIVEKGSKITLQAEELRRVPGSNGDPIRAIQSLPGIVAPGRGRGDLYVRGSSGGQNLFWANRLPLGYINHFGFESTVNPDLIGDFNIFLGGFPVEYSDVLGGVVDIKLRPPRNDRYYRKVRVGINESAFRIEGPIGQSNGSDSFFLAARRSYLDVVLTPDRINKLARLDAEKDNTLVTIPRYYDTQFNWRHELTNGSLDVYYFNAKDSLALNLNAVEKTDPALKGQLSTAIGFFTTGMTLRQAWGDKWDTIVALSTEKSLLDVQIGRDLITQEPFFAKGDFRANRFQPEAHWKMHDYDELTLGSEFTYATYPVNSYSAGQPDREEVDRSLTLREKYRVDSTLRLGSYAPYVKYRRRVGDQLTTTLGARYSRYKGTGDLDMSGTAPRVAVEYRLNERTLLTGTWGKFYQPPEVSQLIPGLSNPELTLTQAEHRIVGVQYKLDDLWSMQLETYHKPMRNLVIEVKNANPPNKYQNLGSGKAWGVDLLVKRAYSERKFGWLSYSYGDSRRQVSGSSAQDSEYKFIGDQPHTLTLLWSQPMKGGWQQWDWGVKVAWHTGQTFTPITGRTALCPSGGGYQKCAIQTTLEGQAGAFWSPTYAARNSGRFPNYFKADVRLDREIRFNTWKLNVYFDLQNVTFSQNISDYDYGKEYEKVGSPEPVAFLPFLLPLFGVEAEF